MALNSQGDSPEDLLDGTGKRLERVLCFGSSETDKLSAREGESGGDEDTAESLEAVTEGTRVIPGAGAPVFTVETPTGTTAKNQDESNDHENDGGGELDEGRPELFLGISERAPDVDEDDEDPENGDPSGQGNVVGPIIQCQTSDSDFERQDDGPLEDVVPAHGETPRGINETGRVGVETTRDGVHDSEFTESVDWQGGKRLTEGKEVGVTYRR